MSIENISKSVVLKVGIPSSQIALDAFESYIEEKLNEKTEKKEPEKLNRKVNVNVPKSF
jgi:hypothetical protein